MLASAPGEAKPVGRPQTPRFPIRLALPLPPFHTQKNGRSHPLRRERPFLHPRPVTVGLKIRDQNSVPDLVFIVPQAPSSLVRPMSEICKNFVCSSFLGNPIPFYQAGSIKIPYTRAPLTPPRNPLPRPPPPRLPPPRPEQHRRASPQSHRPRRPPPQSLRRALQ